MSGHRNREKRTPLILSARMLTDHGWHDVTVRNVSSRGMMLQCRIPPQQKEFIEVRHRGMSIVGRVMWSSDDRFGISTQQAVVLSELLSQAPARPRLGTEERRARPRGEIVRPPVARTEENSRHLARLFDWGTIAVAGVAGAVAVTGLMASAFDQPLRKVELALHGSPR